MVRMGNSTIFSTIRQSQREERELYSTKKTYIRSINGGGNQAEIANIKKINSLLFPHNQKFRI